MKFSSQNRLWKMSWNPEGFLQSTSDVIKLGKNIMFVQVFSKNLTKKTSNFMQCEALQQTDLKKEIYTVQVRNQRVEISFQTKEAKDKIIKQGLDINNYKVCFGDDSKRTFNVTICSLLAEFDPKPLILKLSQYEKNLQLLLSYIYIWGNFVEELKFSCSVQRLST